MPGGQDGLSPARIETLCDGVFAIAMTILVLELHAPDPVAGIDLVGRLAALWPKIASYAVSFIILGTLWVGHHYQFHFIRRSDRALLWVNLFFLLFVSFLPFATALVGSFPAERAAVLMYGATLMAAGLCLLLQWEYASGRGGLLAAGTPRAAVTAIRARVLAGTSCYGVAVAAALFSTRVALALFALMPVLYLMPTRVDRHVGRGAGAGPGGAC
jgi:uncharacterized membrane protein